MFSCCGNTRISNIFGKEAHKCVIGTKKCSSKCIKEQTSSDSNYYYGASVILYFSII